MSTATAGRLGHDVRVMSLIGAGHFLSHFYILTIPPMVGLLRQEFGVSYAEIGLAITGYGLIGGLLQAPVGFLVDRYGARWVLLAGLALNCGCIALMGLAPDYWTFFILAVLAGIGNSVFHPADYAIMSSSIDQSRMGRAYSIHTFLGFFGGGVAPLTMTALISIYDWRMALLILGIGGLVVTLIIALQSSALETPKTSPTATNAAEGGGAPQSSIALLLAPAILLYFAFLIAYGLASGGLSAFTSATLINLQGEQLTAANMALSAFLFAVSAGILAGGVIADRYSRHGLSAAIFLSTAAVLLVVQAYAQPTGLLMIAIFVIVGFGAGAVLPARDLMVRAITPEGATGKVFGFIFVGQSIGASLAPLLFGWILDLEAPIWVFLLASAFMVMSVIATSLAQLAARKRETPA